MAHYTSKVRLDVQGPSGLAIETRSIPLARIHVLADPSDATSAISISPMRRQDAFVALAKHTFVLAPDEGSAQKAVFDRLADSGALDRCARLSYPRSRAAMEHVVRAIASDAHEMA